MIQEKGMSGEAVAYDNSDRANQRGQSATNGVVLFTTRGKVIEANQARQRDILQKRVGCTLDKCGIATTRLLSTLSHVPV